ncbi:hypothetical protein BDZ97DRAFT_1793754 [Flammula alnicola]|nr:hypothetical protein BDZ97DRAFT_1793754 [Flammula alnicola]
MQEVKQIPGEQIQSSQPTLFLRLRSIAFSCIIFLSFLWIILICVVVFAQWDLLNHVERALILIMLFIDTVTVIMLPILLLHPFRPWLDAARILFLILAHCGIALLFALKSPSFKCFSPNIDLDQGAVCTTIVVFANIFSWAIPVLVIGYGSGLAVLVRRFSKAQTDPAAGAGDVEKQDTKQHDSLQSDSSLNSSHEARSYACAV